ncbi:MAG: hypothetical protein WA894_16425, partial [Candidatus Acidiferrum sp.]
MNLSVQPSPLLVCGATPIFPCFDDDSNANGFRARNILLKRATRSGACPNARTSPQRIQPCSREEVSRPSLFLFPASQRLLFANSLVRNSKFPELFLRFDSRADSDDNYVYVTPVE